MEFLFIQTKDREILIPSKHVNKLK